MSEFGYERTVRLKAAATKPCFGIPSRPAQRRHHRRHHNLKMSPAGAHTRGRKGNWSANRELRASGWEQRIFASTIERLERMGQGCRKEKAGNSEPRTESARAPL